MRHGLHFLLVVVLILRGLAGTAMAAGVLPPLLPTGAEHHAQEHSQGSVEHGAPATQGDNKTAASAWKPGSNEPPLPHHPDHHAGVVHAAPECDECTAHDHAHDHHSPVCSACEICHSAMLDVAAPVMPMPSLMGSTQPVASVRFASAPAALAVKPPIA